MFGDVLTHLLALNKQSIDLNYCYCIKQFLSQQIFHISKWWKTVFSNFPYRVYQNLTIKILNSTRSYFLLEFKIHSAKCLLLQNKKPFTQSLYSQRATECVCNHSVTQKCMQLCMTGSVFMLAIESHIFP